MLKLLPYVLFSTLHYILAVNRDNTHKKCIGWSQMRYKYNQSPTTVHTVGQTRKNISVLVI